MDEFMKFFLISLIFCVSLIISALDLTACGSSSTEDITFPGGETEADSSAGVNSDPESSEDDELVPSDEATATPEPNPVVATEYFGEDGNLYKPESDPEGSGQGNLVILLSSKFTEQFDSCEIKLSSGEVAQLICIDDQPWTETPYSCFSNGGRQTWRANFKCSAVAEIKVSCFEDKQEVIFTVSEAERRSVCNRFG